jgi:hypothetical protein
MSREKKSFSPTMWIPSGFLMGVSAICVRRRRYQYELFNFSVNKFISGVNPYNLGVNMYPNGMNQV